MRRRPMSYQKLMTTNWGKRGFLWGAGGVVFSLAWTAWPWTTGWPTWISAAYSTVMLFLAWVNSRHLRAHWRSWREFDIRRAKFLADQRRLFADLAEGGVPEEVAQRIDQLAQAGDVESAIVLISEHLRPRY